MRYVKLQLSYKKYTIRLSNLHILSTNIKINKKLNHRRRVTLHSNTILLICNTKKKQKILLNRIIKNTQLIYNLNHKIKRKLKAKSLICDLVNFIRKHRS